MQHDVVLLAPSGKQQPAVLSISRDGIVLSTSDMVSCIGPK